MVKFMIDGCLCFETIISAPETIGNNIFSNSTGETNHEKVCSFEHALISTTVLEELTIL